MYAIICLREKDGKDIPIPIMKADDEDDSWQPCDNCDLPDACEDFGCAIKSGVRKDDGLPF